MRSRRQKSGVGTNQPREEEKKNLSDRSPDQGRDERMPCGGLTRMGWDTDGDEGAFLSPACLGHRYHLGGGKPPTPKVLTMRHAGPVADPKW